MTQQELTLAGVVAYGSSIVVVGLLMRRGRGSLFRVDTLRLLALAFGGTVFVVSAFLLPPDKLVLVLAPVMIAGGLFLLLMRGPIEQQDTRRITGILLVVSGSILGAALLVARLV
jgi:hypothetical protein